MPHYRLCRVAARTLLLLVPVLASCGGNWTRVGEVPQAHPQDEAAQMLDPNVLYQKLGRFVSPGQVHYVGSVAFVPGHADSTDAIVGLSLANRIFTFERQDNAYTARYRVEYEFDRASGPPIIVGRNETLRVGSFQETVRSDESILLQQSIGLKPGDYQLTVRVRDLGNSNVGTATQRVAAPVFGPGSFTAPILAYRVRRRTSRNDSLSILLNPRGTVAYGGDTLLVYFEGVGFHGPQNVPLEVRDERDSVVLKSTVHFTGGTDVESQVVRIAPDSAPLGQLDIILGPEVGSGSSTANGQARIATGPQNIIRTTSAVVSFSDAWVVTRFDDLLSLLRYFGEDSRINAMKKVVGAKRDSLWKDFYKVTDPNPSTPENEALDTYFARLAIANNEFRESGESGWRTDRGEAFIVLGPPDQVNDESSQLQGYNRIITWNYDEYRVSLTFQDVSGFGRFEMTPTSRANFEQVRVRVQRTAQ
ncbi:MAG TPA: GWxTD domain-containing protein [Gemmatimonadales bacterium]|jgi:GWxTD domain-containing protein|nr:GWxTD domain-containing protein [Gemmatimonadales bacterium]